MRPRFIEHILDGVPIDIASEALLRKGFTKLEGAASRSFDIWQNPEGLPEMIPFSGRPLGQFYDGNTLADILNKY